MKQGFTLSEMLITLGVIGFLATVLLPVIRDAMPNQEQAMFKKAYYITERAVSELVNDDELYPEVDDGNNYLGNIDEVPYKDENFGGKTKFCQLFASKLNRSSEIVCNETSPVEKFTDGTEPIGSITTTDSMVWVLPISDFDSTTEAQEIYIDVNGKKSPNCFYNKSTCKKPDRFTVKVYQDGRVLADGTMEIEYLNKVGIAKNSKAETEQAKKDEIEEEK